MHKSLSAPNLLQAAGTPTPSACVVRRNRTFCSAFPIDTRAITMLVTQAPMQQVVSCVIGSGEFPDNLVLDEQMVACMMSPPSVCEEASKLIDTGARSYEDAWMERYAVWVRRLRKKQSESAS
jgi:hypothetical protein